MRYFIDLSYNGRAYHGWQIQPDVTTVQAKLNHALSTVLRAPLESMGAGRTDTGVHAEQMIAHFDIDTKIDVKDIVYKLNVFLPKDIHINTIDQVYPNIHARFEALSRTYVYKISRKKNAFKYENEFTYTLPLDVDLMNQAAKILFKYTDFQCFSKVKTDVKTYDCTVMEARWEVNNNSLNFTIKADRFLRNMVRAIVGTMIEVGAKKRTLEEFHEIISSKNRSNAGTSAPAHGLYLINIEYPKSIYVHKES
ncbi:MAG: tRNA pseudouridine(38-40) synthase TruA [Flavobacteriaceae bacterium]|nr:tRNA pseudouridine(38-40) synthase TruA [Flavobacteriaceae bacterium]